jgi:anaerobic C4-dicarboxylate transporter
MDSALILLQGAVVIIAILLSVRMGGIGLGLWGLVGLAVLIFVFGLPPEEPPTSSTFIILMVITAASTMQAVGGIDYLVELAKALLKRKPALIALSPPRARLPVRDHREPGERRDGDHGRSAGSGWLRQRGHPRRRAPGQHRGPDRCLLRSDACRRGEEEDPEYQRRVAAGEIATLDARVLKARSSRRTPSGAR